MRISEREKLRAQQSAKSERETLRTTEAYEERGMGHYEIDKRAKGTAYDGAGCL